jgi:hypothetical protein
VRARFTEEQREKPTGRGRNPRSRANLKPFKPGVSGNPGGVRKGTVYLSEVYKRFLSMSLADLAKYQPQNVAEELAMVQIYTALGQSSNGEATLPSTKEITDRTEGKSRQRIEVDDQIDVSLEVSVTSLMQKCDCDRITAIKALAVHLPAALELLEEESESLNMIFEGDQLPPSE